MNYFLRFTIGNIKLAVPVDEVGEIARPKEISRKDKLAKYFIGFIELRKETVPVFDLHEFFAIKPAKRFEVIISDINNSNIGVKVDKVLGIIASQELQSYPDFVKPEKYLEGFIAYDGSVIQVLSFGKLISGQRLRAIRKYL